MGAKNEIAKLSVSQENDEEHDGKTGHVFSTSAQRHRELRHRLVKAQVFEYLDPGQKDHAGNGVVELGLPVAQEFKVNELIVVAQQCFKHGVHFDRTVNVECNAHISNAKDDNVQNIPDGREIFELVFFNLQIQRKNKDG